MAKPGVTVIDRGFKRIQRAFTRKAGGQFSRVGIQGPEATKDQHEGITNVKIAATHEFGREDGTIKERSFFRSTFDKNRKKYERTLAKLRRDMVTGTVTAEAGLRMLGEDYRSDIIDRVRGGKIRQELAESTQKRRGESGPALWDTGQLMGSLTTVLET